MSLGFYVDLASCIGCKTCQVACKDRRDIQVAGPRLRRVDTFECGTYPEVAMFHLNISCNHCESPACVANCPTGAMYKDDDGTVQHDDEACIGCQTCVNSCPYGARSSSRRTRSSRSATPAGRCARRGTSRCAWRRAPCAPSSLAKWTICAPPIPMR